LYSKVFHHVDSFSYVSFHFIMLCHHATQLYYFWCNHLIYKVAPNLEIHLFETFCSSRYLCPKWVQLFHNIPIWVYFGVPWNIKVWHILWPFGIFYKHFACFKAILWPLFIFFSRFGLLRQEKSGNPEFKLNFETSICPKSQLQ
jgi:hypothetical protein